MVKALSQTGLVRYEPYFGVRLTGAGERLAGRVLRRHRPVELFLVQVMGMSWTDVHDEAELLEHAVYDRLIQRMEAADRVHLRTTDDRRIVVGMRAAAKVLVSTAKAGACDSRQVPSAS